MAGLVNFGIKAIEGIGKALKGVKTANTGGRGVSSVATKDFWINPEQIGRDAVESGRKLKNGINLRDLPNYQKGDKVIGSNRNTSGNVQHYVQQKDGTLKKYDIDSSGNAILSNSGKTVNSNLNWARNGKNYQNAPVRYDTDMFTKKGLVTGAAGLGAIGYGVNGLLSSDNESEPAKAQNSETASNIENDSKNGNGFGIADAEPAGLFKSGIDKASSTPKANTNVTATNPGGKPKNGTGVKPKLNYDPIAEWAREDQTTNAKWDKRRENYNRMVGEGVDPYEAYDRSMQEQPTKPVSATNTNTSKPSQNNNRLSYNPMFTDQAIELRRKQQGKN